MTRRRLPTRGTGLALERASTESSRLLFTPEEVERARHYHRPLYFAFSSIRRSDWLP